MLAFWRAIFYSQLAAPIFAKVAEMLNVRPQVCKEYCTSGVMMYGLKWAIVAIVVVALIVAGVLFLNKKKGFTASWSAKKKTVLKVVSVVLAVVFVFGVTLGASTYEQLITVTGLKNVGNSDQYNPENVAPVENSPIEGKKTLWLGSSVFLGFGSGNTSPALFVDAKYGTTSVIETKGGTMLANNGDGSYVPRLKNHDATTDPEIDLVVVQLSTNDSKAQTEVGEVSEGFENFDITTTIGALEEIIDYSKKTWGANTLVIGGSEFQDEMTFSGGQYATIYLDMIEKCHVLDEKWGDQFTFLDLWHNEEMYVGIEAGDDLWRQYMSDAIHPTKKGYLEWWGPYVEEAVVDALT